MLIIKNAEELAKLVDENKNLMTDDDVRIEYQLRSGELENVNCRDLFLGNDKAHFDFVGHDFTGHSFLGHNFVGHDFTGHSFLGHDFTGRNFYGHSFFGHNFVGHDFTGHNFLGHDFTGRNFYGHNFFGHDFNGHDFNGHNFNGKKISYDAFFNCYGLIKCVSIVSRRAPHAEPIALGGQIEYIKE